METPRECLRGCAGSCFSLSAIAYADGGHLSGCDPGQQLLKGTLPNR